MSAPALLLNRTERQRQTRSAIVECIGLRERRTPRPSKRLYRAAAGERDPLAVIERYVADLMLMRDSVPADRRWIYDGCAFEFVDRLSRFVIDARAASEARILGARS